MDDHTLNVCLNTLEKYVKEPKDNEKIIIDFIEQMKKESQVEIPKFVGSWINDNELHGKHYLLAKLNDIYIYRNVDFGDENAKKILQWLNEDDMRYTHLLDAINHGYKVA